MAKSTVARLCLISTLSCVALLLFWTTTDRTRPKPQGDEPHYLIMAASVFRDADLRLRNNYTSDAITGEIYGPVGPHAIQTPTDWWPYHGPGLGILLALPWAIGGTLGARVALCLLAALLAWAAWRWLDRKVSANAATWLTIGLVACPPVLFGTSQIYPDLMGGIVALSLLAWLWGNARRTRLGWWGYWLTTGLLCWLHVKYLAPGAILALMGARQLQRGCAADGTALRRDLIAGAILVLIGPLLLAWFNLTASGRILGRTATDELAFDGWRALGLLLGLHFDQGQGMFFQQPIALLGLLALGYMVRRRDPRTVPFLILYASLIVPNAFQLSRYGGGGPSGRFGWTAMWLWAIPLGIWIGEQRATVERLVRPAVGICLVYQAALALRWVLNPFALFPVLSDAVWTRNSLFPVSLRYSLPSFYFWDWYGYLWYLPNVIWIAIALLLVATGYWWIDTSVRRRLPAIWATIGIMAAIALPVEPTADIEAPRDQVLARTIVQQTLGEVPRRFEAERMAPVSAGSRTDDNASGGLARSTQPPPSIGFAVYGPYISIDPGRYRVELALRLVEPVSGHAARFQVTTARGSRVLHGFRIPADRLSTDGSYAVVMVTLETDERLEGVEFRVAPVDNVEVLVDYVELIPVLPHPAELTFSIGHTLPPVVR